MSCHLTRGCFDKPSHLRFKCPADLPRHTHTNTHARAITLPYVCFPEDMSQQLVPLCHRASVYLCVSQKENYIFFQVRSRNRLFLSDDRMRVTSH